MLVVDNLGDYLVNKDVLQLVLDHENTLSSHSGGDSQHVNSVLLTESIQRVVECYINSSIVSTAPAIRD